MQIRNPIYTSFGSIDCEIDHPVYGWIPYTAEIGGDVFNIAKATAKPYIAPPTVDPLIAERASMTVSRFQALAALLNAGLLSQVNVALANAGPLAQLTWTKTTKFRHNSPTIASLSTGLDLTNTQVDDLFRTTALITA